MLNQRKYRLEVQVGSTRLFKRSTRILPSLPEGEVEVSGPPPAPVAPTTSLGMVLLPAAATVLGLGISVMGAVSNSSSGSTMIPAFLASGLMMGASYLATILQYSSQKKKYQEQVESRRKRYLDYLRQIQADLAAKQRQAATAWQRMDPAPQECLIWAVHRESSLWERAAQDSDFLALRLGTGVRSLPLKIKLPKRELQQEEDPLTTQANRLGEFGQVTQTPIQLPLGQAGVAGLSGARRDVIGVTRAILLQIATLHSPDEVKIAALYPESEGGEWDWLRWLPHVWSDDRQGRYLAERKEQAHRLLGSLYESLTNRKRLLEASRDKDNRSMPLPILVILLADPVLMQNEPILPLLLSEGPALGACTIFLADERDDLPKGCRAVADIRSPLSSLWTANNTATVTFTPDYVEVDLADQLARALAPLRVERFSDASSIPPLVTLLDILGVNTVEDLDLMTRWRASQPSQSLAAPIGRKAGGEPLLLDLHERAHGPHGLGAGTSGSGKSELLQSLVASLAANYHPHELAFVLVDFKSGGMATIFQDLPHLVGTITNLQGRLAARALRSLDAEARRRNALLAASSPANPDIYHYQEKYRRGEATDPMPHLVVVVDEFAQLATEMPDFIKGLFSVARVGRSAGMHLILTTQKPAGVVSDQIWANTRFRFCLRVENPADSQDVLRRPDAAALTRPGQAFIQVGNNEIFERFQAAWGGAPYHAGGFVARDPLEILEVQLDGSRRPLRQAQQPVARQSAATQLQAVVGCINQVAAQAGIQRLRGLWLPPLPETLPLLDVRPQRGWDGATWQPHAAWMAPFVGLLDDPERQQQTPIAFDLGQRGHLIVYGAPGVGKTTLLETLITSLALDHSPEDLNIYILDFGTGILTLFRELPHVGWVALADPAERVQGLLHYLLRVMEKRRQTFTLQGVSTLPAYRVTTGEKLPALVLVVDNYPNFARIYPDLDDVLAQIAQEGSSLGVHLLLTATSPSQVRTRLGNNLKLSIALQLADRGDYSFVVGQTGGMEPEATPGRGLIQGKPPLEFQTALPVTGAQEAERTQALKDWIVQMRQAWRGAPAGKPPEKPSRQPLWELVQSVRTTQSTAPAWRSIPLGLDLSDLEPFQVDLAQGGYFLVTGPAQSGKTTLLQSWMLALADALPAQRLQLFLVDFCQEGFCALVTLPQVEAVQGYLTNEDELSVALAKIEALLPSRRQALKQARLQAGGRPGQSFAVDLEPAIVIAIDDFDSFASQTQEAIKKRLEDLIRRERNLGLHVVVADSISDASNSWEGIIKALKETPAGFLLGSSDSGQLGMFNLAAPLEESGKVLPPGEGYFAYRGSGKKVKIATPWEGAVTMPEWVEQIRQRGDEPL